MKWQYFLWMDLISVITCPTLLLHIDISTALYCTVADATAVLGNQWPSTRLWMASEKWVNSWCKQPSFIAIAGTEDSTQHWITIHFSSITRNNPSLHEELPNSQQMMAKSICHIYGLIYDSNHLKILCKKCDWHLKIYLQLNVYF